MDNPLIRTNETKWKKTRQCACGDCRFFSEEQRPKCPLMVADPKIKGEWLWTLTPDMIGCKDYLDPLDHPNKIYVEEKEAVSEPVQETMSEVAKITVDKSGEV
jgi:hypothetical protein